MLISDKSLKRGVHDQPYLINISIEVELLINMDTGEINNSRILGTGLDEAIEMARQEILENP